MSNINFTNNLPMFPGLAAAVPLIIGQNAVEQTHVAASTIDVVGGSVVVPQGYFCPGSTFRFTLAGSRAGTAGAATLLVVIGSTTAISIAIPTNTAVDWTAQFTVTEHTGFAHQHCYGHILTSATVLSAMDYASATVDVSQQTTIKLQQTLASASDTLVIDHVLIEYWKL
jgi:hypothetical protein